MCVHQRTINFHREQGAARAASPASTCWSGALAALAAPPTCHGCAAPTRHKHTRSTLAHTQPARSVSLAVAVTAPPAQQQQQVMAGSRPRALSVQAAVLPAQWMSDQHGMEELGSPTRKRPRCMADMQIDSWPATPSRPASAGPLGWPVPDPIVEIPTLPPMLSMPMGVDAQSDGSPAATRGLTVLFLKLTVRVTRSMLPGRRASTLRVRRSRMRSLAPEEDAALGAEAVEGHPAQPMSLVEGLSQ